LIIYDATREKTLILQVKKQADFGVFFVDFRAKFILNLSA
jgi:hypothetical protein